MLTDAVHTASRVCSQNVASALGQFWGPIYKISYDLS